MNSMKSMESIEFHGIPWIPWNSIGVHGTLFLGNHVLENHFWKTVCAKSFLVNRFWKTVFGKPLLENRFWKSSSMRSLCFASILERLRWAIGQLALCFGIKPLVQKLSFSKNEQLPVYPMNTFQWDT